MEGVFQLQLNGSIISGKFDPVNESFQLESVKHLKTSSTIGKGQIEKLYQYLSKQTESQVITLEDQLLLPLSKDELNDLKTDLNQILKQLNSPL